MKNNKLLLGLTILSFLGTLAIYNKLPDIIPLQWGINGEVNRTGPKYMSLILGLLPFGLYLLRIVLPKIDPKRASYDLHKKSYNIFTIAIIIFLIIIQWISNLKGIGYDINIGLVVKLLVGILFIIIGNYMSQIRHNYFFGIRSPWTLASEKVWKKTHRVGAYGFVIGGILFIISMFVNSTIFFIVPLAYVIVMVIGVYVYSYIEYKKLEK